jgi:hypothetical protein
MPKPISKDELIKQNPNVDAEELDKALESIHRVRGHGVGGPGYNLVRPFTRKLVRTQASDPPPKKRSRRS